MIKLLKNFGKKEWISSITLFISSSTSIILSCKSKKGIQLSLLNRTKTQSWF